LLFSFLQNLSWIVRVFPHEHVTAPQEQWNVPRHWPQYTLVLSVLA
jgi:hypothetical protein